MDRIHTTAKNSSGPKNEHTFSLPALVVALGLTLVLISFLPFNNLASQRMWTAADADRFDRVSLEYHQSTYQSPARTGLTQSQWQNRRERLQSEFESLQNKLATARQQPHTWSQILLWSGALLTLGGGWRYQSQRS